MSSKTPAPQESSVEPKNEAVAVRCTATEKRAVRFLSLALDTSESDLLRGWEMEKIVAEADRRRALMEAGK